MTFGQMPPANGFLEKKDFKNEYFYEMEVGFSEEISLFQLNNFTPPKNIHTEKYHFIRQAPNLWKIILEIIQIGCLKTISKIIQN